MTSSDAYQALSAEIERLRERADRMTDAWDWAPQLVVQELDTAASLVSILHGDEAIIMGSEGLPAALRNAGQVPMAYSLCKFVVYAQRQIRMGNLREVDYLRDNKMIHEFGAMAYIGVPVFGASGQILGALCAIDMRVRLWTDRDLEVMNILADAISEQLRSA